MLLSAWQKLDLISAKKIVNVEEQTLEFDECFKRGKVVSDPAEGFSVRLPCLEDLIALKKVRKPTPKDLEDLHFLETLKSKKH